jgi:hypothetical protein
MARYRNALTGVAFLFAALLLPAVVRAQPSVNVTGTWAMTYSGSPLTSRTLVLQQQGTGLIGSFGHGGTISGSFDPPLQLNGNWNLNGDSGWITLWFAADGTGFHGQWGSPGRKPDGTFIGRRVYPPVSGLWNFKRTGGDAFFNGIVALTEQGETVVGSYSDGTGQWSGTFRPGTHLLLGTWRDKRGDGWIDLNFALDSRSLNGTWGVGARGSAQSGSLVGSPNTTPPLQAAGNWDVTLTGQTAHYFRMKITQTGRSLLATWPGGHVTATVERGSRTLHGTWQTPSSSGVVSLIFTPDNNGFAGTWGWAGKPPTGRVIGARSGG